VTRPVEPAELGARAIGRLDRDLGERRLEIHAVDEVTVALDRARDLLAEVGGAVEGILDGLHREVRVAAVDNLEESHLGVTRKINVLCTIGYKLHQPTSCHVIIPLREKKNLENGFFTKRTRDYRL